MQISQVENAWLHLDVSIEMSGGMVMQVSKNKQLWQRIPPKPKSLLPHSWKKSSIGWSFHERSRPTIPRSQTYCQRQCSNQNHRSLWKDHLQCQTCGHKNSGTSRPCTQQSRSIPFNWDSAQHNRSDHFTKPTKSSFSRSHRLHDGCPFHDTCSCHVKIMAKGTF